MKYELDYNLKKFGEILYQIRKKENLTQKNIKASCGIHPDTIKGLEHGLRFPNLNTLNKLSGIYKVDLLNVLSECKYENEEILKSIILKLDKISYSDNLTEFDAITKTINKYSKKHRRIFSDTLLHQIKQTELLSELIKLKNKTDIINAFHLEELSIKALEVTQEYFDINHIGHHDYSVVELRILLILGFAKTRQNRHSIGITTTKFAIEHLEDYMKSNPAIINILLQGYYMLSYQYVIVDDNTEIINICDKGIKIAQSNYSIKTLANFYFRKGVSEYKLCKEGYIKSLMIAMDYLSQAGESELRDKYIAVLENKYSISISSSSEFSESKIN